MKKVLVLVFSLVLVLAVGSSLRAVNAADWVAVTGTDWEIDRDSISSNVAANLAGIPVKPFDAWNVDYVEKNQVSVRTRNNARNVVGTVDIYCDRGTYQARDSANNWEYAPEQGFIAFSPLARALALSYCP